MWRKKSFGNGEETTSMAWSGGHETKKVGRFMLINFCNKRLSHSNQVKSKWRFGTRFVVSSPTHRFTAIHCESVQDTRWAGWWTASSQRFHIGTFRRNGKAFSRVKKYLPLLLFMHHFLSFLRFCGYISPSWVKCKCRCPTRRVCRFLPLSNIYLRAQEKVRWTFLRYR